MEQFKGQNVFKPPNMLDLLRKNGWGTGFNNPFANDENRALEKQLEESQRKNLNIRRDAESVRSQFSELKKHEVHLISGIEIMQDVQNAKIRHLECERTILTQAERTYKYLMDEKIRKDKELQYLTTHNRHVLDLIEGRKRNVDTSMQAIEEDVKFIKCFRMRHENLDKSLKEMVKFDEQDTKNITQVHLDLNMLEKINRDLRRNLENQSLSTKINYDHYQRLCHEFRCAHGKRKEMLLLWSATLAAVRSRDVDLQQLAKEFFDVQERLRNEMSTFECLSAFMQQREEELEEVEYRITYTENGIRVLTDKLDKLNSNLLVFKADHTYLATTIQRLTVESCGFRERKRVINVELTTEFEKEAKLNKEVEIMRENRDKINTVAINQENVIKELDILADSEDKRFEKTEDRGDLIRKYLYEKSNQKVVLEEKANQLKTQINLLHRISMKLQATQFANLSLMGKAQSRLYRADLEMSTVEIRISRILNSSIDPKYFKLQTRRDNLLTRNRQMVSTNVFMEKEKEHLYLKLQNTIDDIEQHRQTEKALALAVDGSQLNCNDVQRLSDSLDDDLKQLKCECSLTKLTKSRLQNSVIVYSGKIFNLTQIQSVFQVAVSERKCEIEMHMRLLNKQIYLLKKELTYLETCAFQINVMISKFKGKFELVSGVRLEASDQKLEPGTTLMSEMQALVRERNDLKQQRASWEKCVDQDIKELDGLKNALELVKSSNDAFSRNLYPDPKGDEASPIKKLESVERKVMVFRNRCKKQVEKLTTHSDGIMKELEFAKAESLRATAMANDKELDLSSLKNGIRQLSDRIDRWDQLISRASKNEKIWREQGLIYYIEIDLALKMLEEKYENAMRKLLALIQADSNIQKTIYTFLRENNMLSQFMTCLRFTQGKLFDQFCEIHGEYEKLNDGSLDPTYAYGDQE